MNTDARQWQSIFVPCAGAYSAAASARIFISVSKSHAAFQAWLDRIRADCNDEISRRFQQSFGVLDEGQLDSIRGLLAHASAEVRIIAMSTMTTTKTTEVASKRRPAYTPSDVGRRGWRERSVRFERPAARSRRDVPTLPAQCGSAFRRRIPCRRWPRIHDHHSFRCKIAPRIGLWKS